MKAAVNDVIGMQQAEKAGSGNLKSNSKLAEPGRREWTHEQLTSLASALEREIIPRLLLAQRGARTHLGHDHGLGLAAGDVEALTDLLLGRRPGSVTEFVATRHSAGVTVETLYLDLLVPAARRLGDLWSDDFCDGAEVTLGLHRLQQQLHALSHAFQCEQEKPCVDRRVLLCVAPGEPHVFGSLVTAEFFYRAGWSVTIEFPSDNEALAALVRSNWFDVVTLSSSCALSGEHRLAAFSSAVQALHRASCNRGLGIVAEGRIFSEHPELALQVGADAAAYDSRHAIQQAASTLTLLPGRFHDVVLSN